MPVGNLGWVHLRRRKFGTANTTFTEALHGFELLHDRRLASYAILRPGVQRRGEREWERAAHLPGFADGESQDCGGSWPEPERTYRQQAFADIQRYLETGFDRCYDSGRAGERSDLIDRTSADRTPHNPSHPGCWPVMPPAGTSAMSITQASGRSRLPEPVNIVIYSCPRGAEVRAETGHRSAPNKTRKWGISMQWARIRDAAAPNTAAAFT
jgi:hypothetical protein